MATITVRDLDESTRSKLRIRAARNGRSMEAEVRAILDSAVAAEFPDDSQVKPGDRIRKLVAELGGADDLVIEPRHGKPRPVDFDEPTRDANDESGR
jgi:plasmid stability protein